MIQSDKKMVSEVIEYLRKEFEGKKFLEEALEELRFRLAYESIP